MSPISTLLWQQYAASERLRDKIALRDLSQGEVFTWRQLAEKIDEAAQLLCRQDIEADVGVAICGGNTVAGLCFYLAVLQLKARVLCLNPAFPAAKVVDLCARNAIELWIKLEQGIPRLQKCTQNRPHFLADRPLTMTLTSGSSGTPKAVVHDLKAHLANARGVCEFMQFGADDSWLLSLPLYHVSGQGIVWRWLLQGAELILPEKDFCRSVTLASHVSLVPTQLRRFLTYVREPRISGWRTQHVLLGGSQIPTELAGQLDRLAIQSYMGYGMTEMASTVFAKKSDGKTGVGQPLKGRQYELVNGEIWLRGAGLGLGYWRDGRLVPLVNAQGWLQSGDKGRWFDGELHILGRLDNMFISGGENIQPEEIEQLMQRFDELEQVFVLPVEDAEFGQRPVAMVRFRRSFSETAVNNLRLWLSDKLEKFKQPTAYFPIPTECSQGAIKVSRRALQTELERLLGK